MKARLAVETLEPRLLLSVTATGGIDDVTPYLLDPTAYDPASILVRFRPEAGCDEIACHSLVGRDGDFDGDAALASLPDLRRITLPDNVDVETALAAYRANPDVLYAEPNYRIQIAALPDDPNFDSLWGLNNTGQTGGTADADIDAVEAWDITTGNPNTVVAVIDTGVDYTHEDLAGNLWVNPGEIPGNGIDDDLNGYVDDVHGYDFFNDDGDPMDDHNHGTHVAGTIGAVGNNGVGVAGVNWNVKIMALKFLGSDGSGSTADAIEAINYAVANGATISNNSWGFNGGFSQALYDAIASAGGAGHIFVAAAGNGDLFGFGQNNDSTPFYPSSFDLDNIVAVAALDHDDARAVFSNYGAASVDLGAPGVDILSTTRNNTYGTLSGTSMATPHVTGVAALVRDVHPEWTSQQVIDQILLSVDPVSSLEGITVSGGRLNAAAAVGNPVPPPPPPPSTTLPASEDFDDGVADFFEVRAGEWGVAAGRYHATPPEGTDGIATLRVEGSLPDNLEVHSLASADAATGSYLSNALVIFDYQGPTDFKFAGAYAGADRWLIGERTASGWFDVASFSEVIDAAMDYDMTLTVEGGTEVTLSVGGVAKVTHTFTSSVTDGDVGLGTRNAVAHFDDFVAREFVPPPPPPAGTLPIFEDFDDGLADYFDPQAGLWQVTGGRYDATASAGGDAVSTVRLDGPLPSQVDLRATLNAGPRSGSYYSNGFLIFDYQSPTDFKFAGAYAAADRWLVGHRDAGGWVEEASLPEVIDASRDYDLQVVLGAGTVTFSADGAVKLTHTFGDTLTDGVVGVGTQNAISHFDDVVVQAFVPPPPPAVGTLPVNEDFNDGVADFVEVRSGTWTVEAGRYHVTTSGGEDGVSTVRLDSALPEDLELLATMNAEPAPPGYLSNAFVIFDYQGPADFKFAGAYVGANRWLVGRRTASGWIEDATFSETIDVSVDYDLRVVITGGTQVALSVDGVAKLSHTFADPVTDGDVGVGTRNAVSGFDDVVVREFVPPPAPPAGTLPISEDFNDGVADFFQPRSGSWVVDAGRYQVTPVVGEDGVSTLRVDSALPSNLELEATFNADPAVSGYLSNALVIFDYHGPTDFKFAGAYVGANRWLMGRRTAAGWIEDATFSESIFVTTDYNLRVQIEAAGTVTLSVGGVTKITHTFADSVTDGEVGVGTRNAVSRFDSVAVRQAAGTASVEGAWTSGRVGEWAGARWSSATAPREVTSRSETFAPGSGRDLPPGSAAWSNADDAAGDSSAVSIGDDADNSRAAELADQAFSELRSMPIDEELLAALIA